MVPKGLGGRGAPWRLPTRGREHAPQNRGPHSGQGASLQAAPSARGPYLHQEAQGPAAHAQDLEFHAGRRRARPGERAAPQCALESCQLWQQLPLTRALGRTGTGDQAQGLQAGKSQWAVLLCEQGRGF